MNEEDWLSFYTAAHEIEQRFGMSQAVARKHLRRACADQLITTMKRPLDPEPMPIEFWVRVAPHEWRERDVDYDGPDADGCKIEVMIHEADYRSWLRTPAQGKSMRGKQPRIIAHLEKMFPEGVPDPGIYPRDALKADLLKRDQGLAPLDPSTLRNAIAAYNRSIGNEAK